MDLYKIDKLLELAETVLTIDKQALDEEWLSQPHNVYLFCSALEDARYEADRLKIEVDIAKDEVKKVEAKLELAIRDKPEKYKLSRATEGAVKACVQISAARETAMTDLRAAQFRQLEVEHIAGKIAAVVKGLENKKKALEDFVVLHGRSYFADPRSPKEDNQNRMKEVERRANRRSGSV